MKKVIIQLTLTATIISGIIFSCKKKETRTETSNSNNSTTGATSTGSSTTGTITSSGVINTITISTSTATTIQTLVNFATVNITYPSNGTSFNANTNPNYYTLQSVIPGTLNLNTGVYSASGSPLILGGNNGNLQATINSGLGGLSLGTYIGGNGTFTASIQYNKQRIQYSNITFSLMTGSGTLSTTYTALISADYSQP